MEKETMGTVISVIKQWWLKVNRKPARVHAMDGAAFPHVSVNKELSRDERIAEFVQQIKNPYHFKCGRFTVQASFSAEGATLEECIKGILR